MAKSRRPETKRSGPKGSESFRALFDLLVADWTTLNGKYPDQALFALSDNRVVAAIEKRFEDQSRLKNIRPLAYNLESGLNSVCFEFASDARRVELMLPDTFLILMDGNCKVVALIDPFDPEQPNAFAPLSVKQGAQPFVLSRPTITDQLVFNEADLLSTRLRSREFFLKLGGGGGLEGGDMEIYTTCTYWTQTNLGRDGYNDRDLDDCGEPGSILV